MTTSSLHIPRGLRCGRLLLLGISFLLLGISCSRRLPVLEPEELRGAAAERARDLQALAGDLNGNPFHDRARINLFAEDRGFSEEFAGGWLLLDVARSPQTLFWLGIVKGERVVLQLSAADSLLLLDRRQHPDDGPSAKQRLLVVELDKTQLRLRDLVLAGSSRLLAEGPRHELRIRLGSAPSLLEATGKGGTPFRETTGSWRLEQERLIVDRGQGWKLDKARALDSPYRSLCAFLQAARGGRWRQAEAWTDPGRMFALPGGGHSSHFRANLKHSLPELLDSRVQLKAPPLGDFTVIEDLQGQRRWRVQFDRMPARRGERWVITRLERVLRP